MKGQRLQSIRAFIGLEGNKTSHVEKLVSGAGGFTGILLILLITRQFVGDQDAALIVASMGASAVLLFAVPHGPLSQPWSITGGHLVSAVIGVSCYRYIPDLFIAAAVSVGLAITAMHYLRCIHPPGGATALTAVVAGPGLHDLGYTYIAAPVMLNVAVILATAIVFNYAFPWRRYPAALMRARRMAAARPAPRAEAAITRAELERALQQLDLTIDVTHETLEHIYGLARGDGERGLSPDEIQLGHYYSNGEYGRDWAVRQVVDESGDARPGRDQLIYKVVAGKGRRSTGTVSRDEFAAWAKYEVFLNENSWQRRAPAKRLADAA